MKNLCNYRTVYHLTLVFIAILPSIASANLQDPGNTGEMQHPGHYIALGSGDRISTIKPMHLEAVAGVSKRYHWLELEPRKGEYDFSRIERDLKVLGNKQLVVFFIDKSHGQPCLPDYMHKHRFEITKNGKTFYCPRRWESYYAERYIALATAIIERFDNVPNFEGLAMQESALPAKDSELEEQGYTLEKYQTNLINILTSIKTQMKNSQLFWYSNFLPMGRTQKDMAKIIEEIKEYKIAMGGPDILPYRAGLVRYNYPLYRKYKDEIPLFCSAQGDSFAHHKNDTRNSGPNEIRNNPGQPNIHPEGVISMQEIYDFAVDELFVDYIFWNYYYEPDPRQNTFDDAFEVIMKHRSFNLK